MPYASTTFKWYDQSAIPAIPADATVEDPNIPLCLVCVASDKGPEDMRKVYGDTFYKLYGNDIQFSKYGQPLLQAARIIDAGGRLLIKRVVADDSTLANAVILANLKVVSVQKTDADGNPLYIDPTTGNETTTVSDTKAMTSSAVVWYESFSIADAKSIEEVKAGAELLADVVGTADAEGNMVYKYPIIVTTDIGRGASEKRFRIVPDYTNSKNQDFMLYNFNVYYDAQNSSENCYFAADDNLIFADLSMSLESATKRGILQVRSMMLPTYVENFVRTLADTIGLSYEELLYEDFLFGKTRKNKFIDGITINPIEIEGTVDLSDSTGIYLEEGDNGAFGDIPINTQAYIDKVGEFFDGTFTSDIYNRDNYRIDCCFDANYPAIIKRKIEELANWREDFFYFRDLNVLNSYAAIKAAHEAAIKSRYSASYSTAYDVRDPYSKKQITVTCMYSLCEIVCNHILNGLRHRPLAGSANGFVITDAVENTLNFYPVVTPVIDQKEMFDEERINYADYVDGALTIESLYTCQEEYTQLSFINNVMAIQQAAKAVRAKAPANRFTFMDQEGLTAYSNFVQSILDNYKDNFEELKFVYIQDDVMKANKIFNASISFRFKDFVQSEIFDLYALS